MLRSVWVLLVLLIGFSSGLTAAFAGATLVESLGLTLLGFLMGVVIVWIAFPTPTAGGVDDQRLRWE